MGLTFKPFISTKRKWKRTNRVFMVLSLVSPTTTSSFSLMFVVFLKAFQSTVELVLCDVQQTFLTSEHSKNPSYKLQLIKPRSVIN